MNLHNSFQFLHLIGLPYIELDLTMITSGILTMKTQMHRKLHKSWKVPNSFLQTFEFHLLFIDMRKASIVQGPLHLNGKSVIVAKTKNKRTIQENLSFMKHSQVTEHKQRIMRQKTTWTEWMERA